jgi:tryptophan synthase beta chain
MTNLRAQKGPYFGDFGGRYVPESLIAALDELAEAYEFAKIDPTFGEELAHLHATAPQPPVLVAGPAA